MSERADREHNCPILEIGIFGSLAAVICLFFVYGCKSSRVYMYQEVGWKEETTNKITNLLCLFHSLRLHWGGHQGLNHVLNLNWCHRRGCTSIWPKFLLQSLRMEEAFLLNPWSCLCHGWQVHFFLQFRAKCSTPLHSAHWMIDNFFPLAWLLKMESSDEGQHVPLWILDADSWEIDWYVVPLELSRHPGVAVEEMSWWLLNPFQSKGLKNHCNILE